MADIEHVIVVMMENRSFDEYFGTFPGANGFFPASAPMVQPMPGAPGGTLAPFRTSSFTSDVVSAQGLNHDWGTMHQAIGWPGQPDNLGFFKPNPNDPKVMGYFVEDDVPYHWALARSFALCDNYFCSVLAGTYPNRMYLVSGSIDPNQATSENATVYDYGPEQENWFDGTSATPPPAQDQGPVIYNISPGPGDPIPPVVKVPWGSYLSDLRGQNATAGEVVVSYRVYDDWNWLPPWTADAQSIQGSAGANLNVFTYYSDGLGNAGDPWYVASVANGASPSNAPLQFELDAAAGELPTVAWIHPPYCLCEHPPFTPADGALYLSRIVDALIASPKWLSTVLVIVYDETDTHFDHVIPPLSPDPRPTAAAPIQPGEPYEPWVNDAYAAGLDDAPIGAGMRVPAIIVSPWTYHGGVISDVMDHTSILTLMEQVTQVVSKKLPPDSGSPNLGWRRRRFANLFDVIGNLNAAPVAAADIDRSLATGLPKQGTVETWRTNAWARLNQLTGRAAAPPPGQPAPVAQACVLDIAIESYERQQVIAHAGAQGTATYDNALTVQVVGFEPAELIAPDSQALGQLVELATPSGARWLRAPTLSIVGVPLPGDLQFRCTAVSADPHSVQTAPGVPYTFTFTFSAVFSTPATTFDFAGYARVAELMAAFQVDATVVTFGQILLFGGTMPPQQVSTYQTVVDQLEDHPDNSHLRVTTVHTPKVLMAEIGPTAFQVDDPDPFSVTYTHLFECTGVAEFDYYNNGSGNLEYGYLQFDLPDALVDLTQPDQEGVPVPAGSQPSTTQTPAPLKFKHPGFPTPAGIPADALFVLDRFVTVASPASVHAQDTPLAWSAEWSAAHYNGETGRVALTVQLALLGGNDSGYVSLQRVAYQVSFLAYAGERAMSTPMK